MVSNVFVYKVIDALSTKFTTSEILLNLIFLIIVIILVAILYWDNINNQVNKLSRCKRQLQIYKDSGDFVISATTKSNEKLFDITYDTVQYNTNVECKCKTGNFVNNFNNIHVKDMKNNKNVVVNKTCSCDKYYNTGMVSENIVYSGEPGIIRYMKTDNSDFFDNLVYSAYGS
jgi:ABC-type nickel/cobalt efflux system permease component RcnA